MYPIGTGGPPPGWYPDPAGTKAWRWWSGASWTEWASDPTPTEQAQGSGQPAATPFSPLTPYGSYPSAPAYPSASYLPPETTTRFASETRFAPWARAALFVYVATIALALLSTWSQSADLRQAFHNLRVAMDTGVAPAQNQTTAANVNAFGLIEVLVGAPAFVLFLVWQFAAAKTAQLLALPARRSPGLGVGSWFIPIVNLWFPYQALRGCLPLGHPGRSAVARMWAFYITTAALGAVTNILALGGSPVAFAGGGASLVSGVAFAVMGSRAVRHIGEVHRQALSSR